MVLGRGGGTYFAFFAYSAPSVGFLLGGFRGLGDCHGHVIVRFFGGRIGRGQQGRS